MPRFYHGWRIVIASALIYMLIVGSTYSAYGLFVLPVSAEFGLSRASMNSGLVLINLGTAIFAPFLGWLLDRIPARAILISGAAALGVAFAGLALSRSVWVDAVILLTVLPLGMLAAGLLTMSVVIARWFSGQRGRAIALSTVGMYLGGALVTPAISASIQSLGWRTALIAGGGAITLILILIGGLLRLTRRPEEEEAGAAPVSATTGPTDHDRPLPLRTLLTLPALWLIAGLAAPTMAISQAQLVSLVPLAISEGFSPAQAAMLFSVMSIAAVAGALALALFADRLNKLLLLAGLALVGAVANASLLMTGSYPMLMASAALMGVVNGATPPAFYALLAQRFGPANFGTVHGLAVPLLAAIGMIAIRFVGEMFDRTGDYHAAFLTFAAVELATGLLMFGMRLGRPAQSPRAARPT